MLDDEEIEEEYEMKVAQQKALEEQTKTKIDINSVPRKGTLKSRMSLKSKKSVHVNTSTVRMAERRMSLEDLPSFLQYLVVNEDDKEYIDICCDKLIVLLNSDLFVREGINFLQLIDILGEIDFLQQMGLTEYEPVSVQSTQMMIDILLYSGFFGKGKSLEKRERIASLVKDVNDIALEKGPFKDRGIY